MKKTLIALAIITASSIANADTRNFSGFNIGLGLDATSTNFKTDSVFTQTFDELSSGSYTENNDFGSKQKIIPSLSLGYNFAINEKFLLGIEGKYNLTKGPKSTNSYSLDVFNGDESLNAANISTSIQQKNNWSLALKPGYVLNDKTMVYAKLSYHNSKSTITNSIGGFINESEEGSLTNSQTIKQKGLGFGAGVEHNITKSLFVRAEIEQIRFKSKNTTDPLVSPGVVGVIASGFGVDGDVGASTSVKPTTTVGGITIGYRF